MSMPCLAEGRGELSEVLVVRSFIGLGFFRMVLVFEFGFGYGEISNFYDYREGI